MSTDTPLTSVDNTATRSWKSVRYVFRQMRTPSTRSRHLTETDTEVIRHISDSHYLNKLTQKIDNARVARRQETPMSSLSSSSTEPSPPEQRLDSVSSDDSMVFFYQNQHVRDDLSDDATLHRYSDGVSFAATAPDKVDAYRRGPKRRATSITLRRFGRNVFILNDKSIRAGPAVSADMRKALHERRRLPSADRLVYWTGQENGHSHVVDCDQDMCLCGLLSLSLSVHLICCIEVFFSMVLLIQAPDLLTMNGTYFYFMGLLDGGGETLFILHVSLCASCVLTSLLLYLGTRCTCPWLLLPHLAWQYIFIVISMGISIVLLILGFRGEMLLPSSVVLSAMLIVPGQGSGTLNTILMLHQTNKERFPAQGAKIFAGLSEYREEIFVLFGIFCLISWLIFNLYALREYFFPIYYIYVRRSRHEKIDECYRKIRHAASLWTSFRSLSAPQTPHTTNDLDQFIV